MTEGPEKARGFGLELERRSLSEQAYTKLRHAIVTGRLKPGERLVERRLSLQMGASRTPLREAMIRLEHEGLLEPLPAQGLVVASIDEQEAQEIYAIRIGLEGYAARLAAEHAGSEAVARLREVARRQDAHLAPIELRPLEELNDVFHRTLYAASGMQRLADLIETFREQALHYRIYQLYTRAEVRRGVEQHHEIVDAVERRDGPLVESLVREHILQGMRIVLERRVVTRAVESREEA
jgi:DNA-binding GntR family transcriptional regulator